MNIKAVIGLIAIILLGGVAYYMLSVKPLEISNTITPGSSENGTPTSQKPKAIAINEEASFSGVALVVRSVSEDSRCPKNVTCIWAGRVTVQATLEKGTEKKTGPISLGEPIIFEGVSITLVQVDPEKIQNKEIEPADYRFYFTSKKSSASETTSQNSDVSDLIKVTNPKPLSAVGSPLVVSGEARGTWFFEASFPIELWDSDGAVIARGIGEAEGDWMTENFVPFKATLTFTKPASGNGMLILKKDNPSGLSEHDATLEIPVSF